MSEVRLNIIDSNDAIHCKAHGAVADAVVAALSAEPQTIAELEYAVQRFIKPVDDARCFASFRGGENLEPWDAGLVIVDLFARMVAVESSYSMPQAEGEVQYHDGTQATDVSVPYRVAGDWMFVSSPDEYEAIRDKRSGAGFSLCRDRLAPAETQTEVCATPLDVRQVLYGRPMLEFIALEYAAALERADAGGALDSAESDDDAMNPQSEVAQTSVCEDSEVAQTSVRVEESASLNPQSEIRNPQSDVAWLEELKQAWLNEPNEDFDGRIPSAVIESERRRIPMVMSGKQMMIDENCDLCRLMAGETGEDFGPGFWHLDGCNMDEGFEFSTYRSREEWEEEERRRKEFDEEFNHKCAQGQTSDL